MATNTARKRKEVCQDEGQKTRKNPPEKLIKAGWLLTEGEKKIDSEGKNYP